MFPRKKRLTRRVFETALKESSRASSAHFSAVFPKNAAGYAVIVSKKVARLSVTRHRLKRRVREALRTLSVPLPPALILYPRASVLDMSYDELKTELMKLISGR